jgi:hypothetical protein
MVTFKNVSHSGGLSQPLIDHESTRDLELAPREFFRRMQIAPERQLEIAERREIAFEGTRRLLWHI